MTRTLRSPGLLELVEIGPSADPDFPQVDQGTYLRTTANPGMPDPAALGQTPFPYPEAVFNTVLTGTNLKMAKVELDTYGAPGISFALDDAGRKLFAEYTASHIGDILAIVVDNVVLSAPRIQSAILEGQGVITGKFTLEEAEGFAAQMRSGPLPAPLRVLEMHMNSGSD